MLKFRVEEKPTEFSLDRPRVYPVTNKLNISIRTDFLAYVQNLKLTDVPDKLFVSPLSLYVMNDFEIFASIIRHQDKIHNLSSQWLIGVRFASRVHPWDEEELALPSNAWFGVQADTSDQAQRVVRLLLAVGFEKSPLHTESLKARHVFVYSQN